MKRLKSALALLLLSVMLFNLVACLEVTKPAPTCPTCGTQYGEDDAFCNNCGTKLNATVACIACGAENTEGSRYCSKCGSALTDEAPDNSDNSDNGNNSDNSNTDNSNTENGNDNETDPNTISPKNYNNLLLIEKNIGESQAIVRMLGDAYRTTIVNITDTNALPSTLPEMCVYGEIILCNVSGADFSKDFDRLLRDYVYEAGGGLFTTCGTSFDSEADVYGDSLFYQLSLPVYFSDYTYRVPTAVAIVLDTSGSMVWDKNGNIIDPEDPLYEQKEVGTKLYFAKQGIEGCLETLSDTDYIGIYTTDENGTERLPLTQCTRRDEILTATGNIKGGGGTFFSYALEAAGKALLACSDVERRHVIIITDGEPNPDDIDLTSEVLAENAKNGITTAIIGIQSYDEAAALMKNLLTEYAGMDEENFYPISDPAYVAETIHNNVNAITAESTLSGAVSMNFTPIINIDTPITDGISQDDIPSLNGFYVAKAQRDATVVLSANNFPLYTYRSVGKGRVGTFSCALDETMAADFINSEVGATLLRNIIACLCPTKDAESNQTT